MYKLNTSIFLLLFSFSVSFSQTGLVVNEVISTNQSTFPQAGEYHDWIEIFNTTNAAINISGYHLTDDPANKTKHKLPVSASLVVPSNGYLMLFANSTPNLGANHLNFGLSSDGEQVLLYDPAGTTLVDSLVFPKLKADVSFGKLPNGERKYFFPATPNLINNAANSYLGILAAPTFSHNGGFYSAGFNLDITSADQANIIYSLDGSDPTPENLSLQTYNYKINYPFFIGEPFGQLFTFTYQAFQYSGSIAIADRSNENNKISTITTGLAFINPNYKVNKGTVVKAMASKPNYLSSEFVEQSYFINNTGTNPYKLPIISLGIQENKLFDYYNGAYIPGIEMDNYRNQFPNEQTWGSYNIGNYYRDYLELNSSFNYIPDKNTAFSQNVGVKIHGNMSRHIVLKSLRIYARSIYGKDNINYKLFDYQPTTIFKRIILRNSGGDFNYTMFRDGIVQKSVHHLNFDTQSYTPSVTYINGEFWGILNIRERFDDDYFSLKYGFSKDSLDLLENENVIEYGEATHYNETLNFIKNNNISVQANLDEALRRVDLDNMIDYFTSELYFSNQDWPNNNITYWRYRNTFDPTRPKGKDGRWRWSMYDMDGTTGSADMPNPSASYDNVTNFFNYPSNTTVVFTKLFENTAVKNKFLIRNADLLNTTFKPDRIVRMINENKIKLKEVILEHVKRWREPLADAWASPVDTTYWASRVNVMKNYIIDRPDYYYNIIKNKFGVSGDYNLTLQANVNQGFIKVNTININSETPGVSTNTYPWVGKYFDNLEARFEAFPKRGYKFVHWLINGVVNTNPIVVLTPNSDTTVEAIFQIYFISDNPFPAAFSLQNCDYSFTQWPATSPINTFPTAISFVYFDQQDPGLSAEIQNNTSGRYNLTSRTRINGLGENGVSFINTGNVDGNVGYPGVKLGGLVMAINTENITAISLAWKGRTIVSNSKEYKIRLQYRYGDIWPFEDLLDGNGQVIEYTKQANGQSQDFFLANLPASILNKDHIQLLWRYYYTGNTANPNSDSRDQLAIDDIIIKTEKHIPMVSNVGQVSGVSVIKSFEEIPENQQRIYLAKDFIDLLPNFNSKQNVYLDAKLGGCIN
jgi:CotH kinase protein/Lamin Tail Domain